MGDILQIYIRLSGWNASQISEYFYLGNFEINVLFYDIFFLAEVFEL